MMNLRGTRAESRETGNPEVSIRNPGAARAARRAFVAPRLTRHEPLTRITLVSGSDFTGSGGSGGTFFGG